MGHSHSRDGDGGAYDIEEGSAWGAPASPDADGGGGVGETKTDGESGGTGASGAAPTKDAAEAARREAAMKAAEEKLVTAMDKQRDTMRLDSSTVKTG